MGEKGAGTFLNWLKRADITSIYKKEDSLIKNFFIRVDFLHLMKKIKIVLNKQISEFVYKILFPNLFGLRTDNSTWLGFLNLIIDKSFSGEILINSSFSHCLSPKKQVGVFKF